MESYVEELCCNISISGENNDYDACDKWNKTTRSNRKYCFSFLRQARLDIAPAEHLF